MANIRNISEIEPTLGFTEFDILTSYEKSFRNSELGRLHSIFPIKELSRKLGLKYSRLGRTSYFSPEGKIALMLLKSYTNLPDRLLIEQLNGNIHYQLFCGIMIHPSNPITNYKIVSAIRREIAEMIDIPSLQEVLAQHWKGYLNNKHVCMTDATCYESYLRFPTDVKLLWESVEWLYRQICSDCARLGIRRPRNKYSDVSMAYLSYSKNRKRKNSRTRMIKRRLLHLLDKLLYQTDYISTNYPLSHTHDYYCRLSIICKVLLQGRQLFDGEPVNDRIVSIDKHYIRPIVRGKENKSVEFGAKVNNIQIDGISFIEHLSFDSFNEGRRLRSCIHLQQKLMGKRVRAVAADAIYATNANRRFCTKYGISTSFVRKGKMAKDENVRKILRSELSKERATRLEGSFGTHKQHYCLAKIKARNKKTEILWIFFGIHTSNAVILADRIKKQNIKAA